METEWEVSCLIILVSRMLGAGMSLLTPSAVLRLESKPISSDPLAGRGGAYLRPYEAATSYVTLWSQRASCWESGEGCLSRYFDTALGWMDQLTIATVLLYNKSPPNAVT